MRGSQTAKRPNVMVDVDRTSHRLSAVQVTPAIALVVEVPATVPDVAMPGTVVSLRPWEMTITRPAPPRTSA